MPDQLDNPLGGRGAGVTALTVRIADGLFIAVQRHALPTGPVWKVEARSDANLTTPPALSGTANASTVENLQALATQTRTLFARDGGR
jgi:hypothetical protein